MAAANSNGRNKAKSPRGKLVIVSKLSVEISAITLAKVSETVSCSFKYRSLA